MSSILTNTSAMVALQTMKSINSNLNRTQSEISTGKTVATAKDNAAVWAISKVMESDVKGFKGISDSLSLGSSTISVARQASETVTDLLTEIKGKIVAAQEENVDRAKMQTDIKALRDQISTVVGAAQFNGLNMIKGTDDVNILSSLDRSSNGNVAASNITVERQDLTTSAGTYGSGTSLAANAVVADSATAVASAGNTAEVTFAATWAANDTATLTVAGVDVNYTATGAAVADIAAGFAGAINALGLEGVTASNSAGVLTITSTRAFEGLSVAQTSTTAGDGTTEITAVNGGAPAGDNTATASTISQRAEKIDFSTTAAVNEGDGYKVTVGTSSYNYVAGKGETMPAMLSEAGKLTPRRICDVGLPTYWLALMRTGSSEAMVSRGNVFRLPSGLAGNPIRTCPVAVRKTPSLSARKDPVVTREIGKAPVVLPSAEASVTARKPRPSIARSVEFVVAIKGPRSSIKRWFVVRTPSAE